MSEKTEPEAKRHEVDKAMCTPYETMYLGILKQEMEWIRPKEVLPPSAVYGGVISAGRPIPCNATPSEVEAARASWDAEFVAARKAISHAIHNSPKQG